MRFSERMLAMVCVAAFAFALAGDELPWVFQGSTARVEDSKGSAVVADALDTVLNDEAGGVIGELDTLGACEVVTGGMNMRSDRWQGSFFLIR